MKGGRNIKKKFIFYGKIIKEKQTLTNPFSHNWVPMYVYKNGLEALKHLYINKSWDLVALKYFHAVETYMEPPIIGDHVLIGGERCTITNRECDIDNQAYHLYTDHILERIPEDEKKTQALQEEMNAVEEQILDYFQEREKQEISKSVFRNLFK